MSIQEVELYTPHSGQMRLHESQARFRVCCCGRRWGKSLGCSNEMAKFAIEHNDVVCMWVAPTYRQTQIIFRLMAKALEPVIAEKNKSELALLLVNGSRIQFGSAERHDNLRGDGIHFLVLDECAQIVEEAWTSSLRATLSDTNGRAIFIGTPRGRNWFWKLFQRGLVGSENYNAEWASFTFPTSSNPYIPSAEIEDVRATLPEDVYRQEYLAEFLEESAGVFHGIEACVRGSYVEPVLADTYLLGWDVAKHTDFSVLTVLNVNTMHVDYWERFNKIDYIYQVERVYEISQRYHASVIMDATGVGDPLLEQIQAKGLFVEGIKFNNILKEQMIRNLALMLEQQRLSYPRIPTLLHELTIYEYAFTASGTLTYSAPSGEHDDCVISLALVAWKAQNRGDIPAAFGSISAAMRLPEIVESGNAQVDAWQQRSLGVLSFLSAPDLHQLSNGWLDEGEGV